MLVVLLLVGIYQTAAAEFYQYRDKDGNLRFTDDLSQVPAAQRPRSKRYDSFKGQTPPAPTAAKPTVASRNKRSSRLKPGKPKSMEGLQQQQQQLNAEFAALMKTKAELEERGKTITADTAMEQYNQEVLALNERIQQYRQKQAQYNAAVAAYNESVQ